MNDAFEDFEWAIAPRYEWQERLNRDGTPIEVPEDELLGLDAPEMVEMTWRFGAENDHQFGPVLSPLFKDISELRQYHPMRREHAALFREFADLDYKDKPVLQDFATRYGLLGVPLESQATRVPGPDGELVDYHAYGEPYVRWAVEICFMREGVRLADANRSPERSRRLKWLFDRHLQDVQGRLAFNQAGQPRLLLEPLTLIAAMWLQLALAVTGEKRFVACKFCRRMFEISTAQTGFRSHREFCSDSCKTMDYRKRQRTARALAASGAQAAEIAEKTGTDKATIRKWLLSGATKRRPLQKGRA